MAHNRKPEPNLRRTTSGIFARSYIPVSGKTGIRRGQVADRLPQYPQPKFPMQPGAVPSLAADPKAVTFQEPQFDREQADLNAG